jgi:hypothetical protein
VVLGASQNSCELLLLGTYNTLDHEGAALDPY